MSETGDCDSDCEQRIAKSERNPAVSSLRVRVCYYLQLASQGTRCVVLWDGSLRCLVAAAASDVNCGKLYLLNQE